MTFLITSAVKLVLDFLVLVAMGAILGRKKEPRYVKLLLGSLAVAAAYAAYDLLPRWLLGYLFVLPLIAAAAIVLAVYGRVRWKQAAVAATIFFVIHAVAGWFV